VRSAVADGESVRTIVPLGPPAVENGKIEAAIEDDLLPAGTRCLQRQPWIVQPNVDALHEMPGQIDVVILDEDDFVHESLFARQEGDFLQNGLSLLVLRVRLSGKNQLQWPLRVVDQRGDAVQVGEDEIASLIGREPACKANRERIHTKCTPKPTSKLR
jgi:hypothetical protein